MSYYWTIFYKSSGEIIQSCLPCKSVDSAFKKAESCLSDAYSRWMSDEPVDVHIVVEVKEVPSSIYIDSSDPLSLEFPTVATREYRPVLFNPRRLEEIDRRLSAPPGSSDVDHWSEGPWIIDDLGRET